MNATLNAVDSRLRAIRHDGRIIGLTPRSFAVVEYLAAHADRVVGKDELLAELWPRGSSEHALRQEIYSLRRQLAKHGASSCVVTISQYGYRFEPAPQRGTACSSSPFELTQFAHRALAATSFFELKSDTAGWKRALVWYERLSAESPELLEAHLGAARAAIRLALRWGLPPKEALGIARRHVSAAARSNARCPKIDILSAALDGLLHANPERALRSLHDLGDADPSDPDAQFVLAMLHLAAGNLEQALETQRAAMIAQPRSLEARLEYGRLLLLHRDVDAAHSEFAFLTKLQPENSDAVEGLGAALILLGQHDRAIAVLQSIPWTVATGALQCVALARNGRCEEARNALEKLLETKQHDYVSGYYLARCYAALGEIATAKRRLSEAGQEPLAWRAAIDPFLEVAHA